MINNFFDITKEDIKYLRTHPCTISEKLDMVYFKVEINERIAIPLKPPKFAAISDVDCITNSVNKMIRNFVFSYIMPIGGDIVEKYGPVRLGFFFAPVPKPRKIVYSNLPANLMILNDVEFIRPYPVMREPYRVTQEKKRLRVNNLSTWFQNEEGDMLMSLFRLHDPELYNKYTIRINSMINADAFNMRRGGDIHIEKSMWEERSFADMDDDEYYTAMSELIAMRDDPIGAIKQLNMRVGIFKNLPSYNPLDKIEGIIIKCGKKQWQIQANDSAPHIDKSTKKVYRDIVLKSLVRDLLCESDIIDRLTESKSNYIDKVCLLFNEYMKTTDIFAKVFMDPEDLLPPIEGYIGNLDLDGIRDAETIEICKNNETAKNLLRMFLHTFTHSIMDGKFEEMTDDEKNSLQRLTLALGYRNYADIALTMTK